MTLEDVVELIRARRSVRTFTGETVPEELIATILEAGRWAPSGLNNQPWKFLVIREPTRRRALSRYTSYGRIVKECDVCIAVFYDTAEGYHRDKDFMALGACVQNMLLAAHAAGLGAVWLGEILNRKHEVIEFLHLPTTLELAAVVAIGWPAEQPSSSRKDIDSLLIEPR